MLHLDLAILVLADLGISSRSWNSVSRCVQFADDFDVIMYEHYLTSPFDFFAQIFISFEFVVLYFFFILTTATDS